MKVGDKLYLCTDGPDGDNRKPRVTFREFTVEQVGAKRITTRSAHGSREHWFVGGSATVPFTTKAAALAHYRHLTEGRLVAKRLEVLWYSDVLADILRIESDGAG